MFAINFAYHLLVLTAQVLRRPFRMEWKKLMLLHLRKIHVEFLAYRDDANRRATYVSQVMVVERMLNIIYYDLEIWATPADPTASGHIYILTIQNNLPTNFQWFDDEGQDAEIEYFDYEGGPPLFIYFTVEYFSATSFTVMVPASLTFSEPQMRGILDRIIYAGYNYTIQTY